MKTTRIFLLFFLSLAIFSCKKDKVEEQEEEVPETNDKDEIVYGDYTKMIVNSYNDSVFIGTSKVFDLDNDQVADIKVNFIFSHFLASYTRVPQISCLLPNVEFFGNNFRDSIFSGTKITGKQESNYYLYTYDQYKSCSRVSPKDSFLRMSNTFKISGQDIGFTLKKEFEYKSTTDSIGRLTVGLSIMPVQIYNATRDTLIQKWQIAYKSCNAVPSNQTKYLGIKIKKNGTEKIGWIKILVEGPNFRIFESAIQK